uniref:Lamin-C-like n=1 Tax=Saccoglossus kowalevskii TaxID=10224 RepID=A0ABM0MRN6_SACKO|nr:PREDICTED: lamin-C-like [Saccoglossus kowalevskii]
MTRQEEKKELSQLNLRYAEYIEKVHKLVLQASQSDSSALLTAIHNLEGEVVAIKTLYERELESLRSELQRAMSEGQRLEMSEKKQTSLVLELQGRLASEQQQNQAIVAEMGNMKQLVAKMELEIRQITVERDGLAKKMNESQREGLSSLQKMELVNRKLETETLAKNEALNALNNLQKKIELQMRLYAEEVAELKSRLDNKGKQILMLEGKLKQMGHSDNSLQVILARVRETADADLQKYKKESEAQYAKNLQELQIQMRQDTGYTSGLADENKKLNGAIEDYRREIQLLQGKIRTLEQNNGELTTSLNGERQKSSVHIQSLEVKLQEIQEKFIHKLQELGSGKEPPIRAEIEALKAMLAQEEKRLETVIGQQTSWSTQGRSNVGSVVIYTGSKSSTVNDSGNNNNPSVLTRYNVFAGSGGSTGFGGTTGSRRSATFGGTIGATVTGPPTTAQSMNYTSRATQGYQEFSRYGASQVPRLRRF